MAPGDVRPDRKVPVSFLFVPVRVDGISWSDSEGKKAINAGDTVQRFLDLHGTGLSPDLMLRAAYNLPQVAFSNAIVLHDGDLHFFAVHSLGFRENPVVFNNSCSSWEHLGDRALHAGARAYICTAWPVEDPVATDVAIRFVDIALRGAPLALALKEATAHLPHERNPYVYVGLPFSRIREAPEGLDVTERWKRRAEQLRAKMAERLTQIDDPELARTIQEGIAFIDQLLKE